LTVAVSFGPLTGSVDFLGCAVKRFLLECYAIVQSRAGTDYFILARISTIFLKPIFRFLMPVWRNETSASRI